jgi:DNA mismatch endonuclease Vsr
MSRIKSKGTSAELLLGKAMWRLGLRYRKHYPIAGRPDFAFVTARVAVFCDGDFWHGRDFKKAVKAGRFDNDPDYWIPKLRRTLERDKRVNKQLRREGWLVIRFWASDIPKRADELAAQVLAHVRERVDANI